MTDSLRIPSLGLGPKCASLLEAGLHPKDVAATLNAEELHGKLKDQLTPLTARDVRLYKDFLDRLESQEIASLVTGSAQERQVVARLQGRIVKTLDLLDSLERMTVDVMDDFKQARSEWAAGMSDAAGNRTAYPVKQMGLLLKVISENRQVIASLHQDKGVQSFVRNATVNVNQGMPIRDVYAVVRELARVLDVPMDTMMTAFAEAQNAVSSRTTVIDANAQA